MAKLICELVGVRGRVMKVYDKKCVIITEKTIGSLLTGNITDGEKTIFLSDVVGVQFKKSGKLIGYLQLETPSMQMNNKDSNMFSENTFTFEDGKNGVTNDLIEQVYKYLTNRIEEIKFGENIDETTTLIETIERMIADNFVSRTQEEEEETVEVDAATSWDRWDDEDSSFGKCEVCGEKRCSLLYVEFDAGSDTVRKNVCFNCFSQRKCRPVGSKK